jgi:glutamate--cysteine ligase
MLPVDRLTRRPRPLDGGPGSVLDIVRDAGAARGWVEAQSKKAGVPEFHLADGSRITFEPGGQIEYSSPAFPSASRLLDVVRRVIGALEASAERNGAEMLFVGIDPLTAVQDVAPQLDAPRYTRMRRYFASIGPSGARMMRQTASFQVSVDAGDDPVRSWRFLNALAPYLVAIFANSPVYEGRCTGHQSVRREVWATLDPRRTGLPGAAPGDAAEAYVDFALDAPAFLLGEDDAPARPFRDWLADDAAPPSLDDWHTHLSTLFPEVRPRGDFELRSADAVAPEWHAAPLALVAGLMYDATAFAAAEALLGAADRSLLDRVGRDGLRDAQVGEVARRLWSIAAEGCRRLGPAFLGPADLDAAEDFFRRYTLAGRSPADDPRDEHGVPERARRRLARIDRPASRPRVEP